MPQSATEPAEQALPEGDGTEAAPLGPKIVLTPQDIARLWSKIDQRAPDECWPWTAGRHTWGYGQFWVSSVGRCPGAHHVIALLHHGPAPEGMQALHSCDNPPCCNPAHIRWGTPGENMAERDARGRNAHGERQHLARLTAATVRQMRAAYAAGVGTPELGRQFGVHTSTAWAAVTRRTWRHVA